MNINNSRYDYTFFICRVSLNVSMRGIPGLFHFDSGYFRIVSTPLVAVIDGGSARSVSFDKEFVVDAWTPSYDPDIEDTSDMTGITFR